MRPTRPFRTTTQGYSFSRHILARRKPQVMRWRRLLVLATRSSQAVRGAMCVWRNVQGGVRNYCLSSCTSWWRLRLVERWHVHRISAKRCKVHINISMRGNRMLICVRSEWSAQLRMWGHQDRTAMPNIDGMRVELTRAALSERRGRFRTKRVPSFSARTTLDSNMNSNMNSITRKATSPVNHPSPEARTSDSLRPLEGWWPVPAEVCLSGMSMISRE